MNSRTKWFVALSRSWCTWRYGGTRDQAIAEGHELIAEQQYADAKGFWVAPSHRSRARCDTDCQEHKYTVEPEIAEWIPREDEKKKGARAGDNPLGLNVSPG